MSFCVRRCKHLTRDANQPITRIINPIGHFRLPKTLSFKTRLSAKQFFYINGFVLSLALKQRLGLMLFHWRSLRVFLPHVFRPTFWLDDLSVCLLWLVKIFITWQYNFHWPASLSIWASSEGGFSMRSFLGVRLQTRTLLSSNPPDRRLESSDILTVFKLREKQED